eukprot:CAMPEP_0172515038 /NCGR_PEP_ID=MMETSP1066-20121228/264756_1 /TAXON_ID=671091 /ORGANISM="Coscinodiscus wailesii, Strain CCMP2513" /LENGTH=170 /DNA_ID=CAMNT_0013295947 /DNA_START=43 /DNA_END=552 /DNA_ORIENTATION=+
MKHRRPTFSPLIQTLYFIITFPRAARSFLPRHSFLLPPPQTPPLPIPTRKTAPSPLHSTTPDTYDVITIGAGIGGLCASALTSQTYNLTTLCLEAHDTPGGCAHSFTRSSPAGRFSFDSGPSLLSGMSRAGSTNPLKQVLDAVGEEMEWVTYDGWCVYDFADGVSVKLTT